MGELKEGMIATTMQGVMNISAINENPYEFQSAYVNESNTDLNASNNG